MNARPFLIWEKSPLSPAVSKEGKACGFLCEVSMCMQRVNKKSVKVARREYPTATRNISRKPRGQMPPIGALAMAKECRYILKYSPVSNEHYAAINITNHDVHSESLQLDFVICQHC
jgi:hypothetical protein